MNTNSITKLKESFDLIAQTDHDSGIEFWYARELMSGLGYERWENFYNVIKKAIVSCENSGAETQNHFRDVKKMVDIGSGISRPVEDIMLTRYACYLIALPPAEDLKKLERKVKSTDKKMIKDCELPKKSGKKE